jgi:hypothetical protein
LELFLAEKDVGNKMTLIEQKLLQQTGTGWEIIGGDG